LLIRCILIGVGRYAVVLVMSGLTGATLDLPNLWLIGFCEMFFNKRQPNTSAGVLGRFSVLGKMLWLTIVQFLAYLMGVALWSARTGNAVYTSDCLTGFADSCVMKPYLVGIAPSNGRFTGFIGFLIVMGSYFVGWALTKRIPLWVALITKNFAQKYSGNSGQSVADGEVVGTDETGQPKVQASRDKYVPWIINDGFEGVAKSTSVADFTANVIFSTTNGTGFVFWFWFVTSIYTNDYTGADNYVWLGFAAGLFIFVAQLLYWLLASASANSRNATLMGLQGKRM